MTVEELREISLKLPGTTEDIKWGYHLCFSIAGKMYLITSPDIVPSPSSFKVSVEIFDELTSQDGFSKHAYLGRHHWHLDDINRLTKKEWEQYIKQSYQLVAEKLSIKKKKLLGIKD